MPPSAVDLLAEALSGRPGAEARPGQEAMCAAVEEALASGEHLLVEAPTGTGKSLAYLVPAVAAATGRPGARVVVVTATKALQEQLVGEDLPFLHQALQTLPFRWAMLKGRSNYLCRAKLEVTAADGVLAGGDLGPGGAAGAAERVAEIGDWAEGTDTGDRADLPFAVTDALWGQVSVGPGECPGAAKCPSSEGCFSEAAREAAARADLVVTNTHLYAAHLASGRVVLPEHDAVIFDEGHTLEDVAADAFGVRLTANRVRGVAGRVRRAGVANTDRLDRAAAGLEATLAEEAGAEETRVRPAEGNLATVLTSVAELAAAAGADVRRLESGSLFADAAPTVRTKVAQAQRSVDDLVGDVRRLLAGRDNQVAWVERARAGHELRLATIDVGPVLAGALYPHVTVVATSATLATAGRFEVLARKLGLTLPPPPGDEDDAPPPEHRGLVVDSPFDHRRQGFLYVARHLPAPNDAGFTDAMHAELAALVGAAGGRTLALFTSRAAMDRAAGALEAEGRVEVLVQDRLPRRELLERFRAGPGSVLVATQGFWQGVDLPGRLCHLVTVDRIPFPRPTDPLVVARREAAQARGESDFGTVDLPAAATLLAQGTGRLIRSTIDKGVVAVFDRRLAVASYRTTLLATMPPLRRTVDREAVLATLRGLRTRDLGTKTPICQSFRAENGSGVGPT